MLTTMKQFLMTSTLLFILGLTAGCAVNPVSGKQDFVLMSNEQEVQLGNSLHKQILRQQKPYNNPALQAYVNNIGQRLAQQSHRNNIRYTFTVINDPSINAFATPGGFIYITTGLMGYLNSEAQLAGVLGHEIGHVTARHSVRQQSRTTVTGLLASVITNNASTAGARQLVNAVGVATIRGFGRKHELQADRLGAEYLARVGYNPKNMIDVVGVLKSQEDFAKFLAKSEGKQPPTYHGTFATHPSNDRRLQEVVLAARRFPSAGRLTNNESSYLNRVQGLPFRVNKKQTARIRVITARPGMTYASLARNSILPKYAEQKLRLLNGMFPTGEPRTGQLLKIVAN